MADQENLEAQLEQARAAVEQAKKDKEKAERERDAAEEGQYRDAIRSLIRGKGDKVSSSFKQIGVKSQEENVNVLGKNLSVSNDTGDLAVPHDLVRAIMKEGIVPPLSLLDDQTINYNLVHHVEFLPNTYDAKALTNARKSLMIWREADHFMPIHKLFAALLKLGALTCETVCVDENSKKFVRADFAKFTTDMVARSANDGIYRITREYVILRLASWTAGVENNIGWDTNRLSTFDERVWATAIVAAGGRSEQDSRFKSEIGGAAETAWGCFVKLVASGAASATAKVREVIQEDKVLGAAVLAGNKAEGELPASLGFQHPAAAASSAARARNGGGAAGSGANSGGSLGKKRPAPGANPGPNKGNAGGNGNVFRCLVCGEPAHRFADCKAIPDSLTLIDGRELAHKYEDAGRPYLCRNFNINRCTAAADKCSYSHGCAACGEHGHPSTSCAKRA